MMAWATVALLERGLVMMKFGDIRCRRTHTMRPSPSHGQRTIETESFTDEDLSEQ